MATPTLAPTFHYHPLSSYCQKVLIAADVLGVALDLRPLNPRDPAEHAAFVALWPTGKMPLLVDEGRPVPETSIQIEYLQRYHARHGAKLLPADPDEALQVRLWDRLFDLYVMTPMQAVTVDLLTPEAERQPGGAARSHAALASAYDWIDRHLQGRTWAATGAFSMADCAAFPALFYAIAYEPLAPRHVHLAAYFERLVAHPAVARVIEQARPFYAWFPGRAGLDARFIDPTAA